MNICIVTPGYPIKGHPFFVFVERLVNEFADLGCNCTVISPQSITENIIRRRGFSPKYSNYKTIKGNNVNILRPYYLSFSNYKLGKFFSFYTRKKAIEKVLEKGKIYPDVIYAHFWEFGLFSFNFARKREIPLFIASGESEIPSFSYLSKSFLSEFSSYVSGVICVSSKNKHESINLGLTKDSKCIVLNNGIDKSSFYKKDKIECRKKMGFPLQDFIIIFIGAFIDRKGSKRVSQAINILSDDKVKSIFIGRGSDTPTCEGVLYSGSVENDKIIDFLNCADVFVLPTLKEGCCNAIIEAMACGLPIISSSLSFNDDILNEINSIRINPYDVNELAKSIKYLKNSPDLIQKMGLESLKISSKLSVNFRAKMIIEFINNKKI
ncbi:glycosyltransferase [Flavobacteriaceae bacterium]|nr:glycosyltransferase [Flavobacteriaceae bacterium]